MSHQSDLPPWISVFKLPMPATLGTANIYLLEGKDTYALVDTGMNDVQSRDALEKGLETRGLGMSRIDEVICTHHHADHAGLGATLAEQGAKITMSQADAAAMRSFFDNPQLDAKRATFYDRHPVPALFEERVSHLFPFFRKLAEDFTPTRTVSDRDTIDTCGRILEVWATPGHTPGHICLVDHTAKIIFTGDHILKGDATHVSMRPESQGTDPLGSFLHSLARLESLSGYVALPGHGAPFTDIPLQAARVIKHHTVRLSQFARATNDVPQTAFDLSIKVMGKRRKVFAQWLAMSQALAYLEHLCKRGEVRMLEESSGIHYCKA